MGENILRLFQHTVESRADEPCLRFKKDKLWRHLTWAQCLERIKILAESLKTCGVQQGDRVALLSNTRYEWPLIDMAILSLGAICVPIYQSSKPEDISHIVNDSGSKLIFVEDQSQLEKLRKVSDQLKDLKTVVLIEGAVSDSEVLSLEAFEKLSTGQSSDFGTRIRHINLEDLATLVYTSGTTGAPKGVMITHENIYAEVVALDKIFPAGPESESLMFLPLAHILARVVQFFQFAKGFTHAYAESIDKLGENISEIKPHFMVCVPRIFEKIYQNMMVQVENGPALKKSIFYWAREVGTAYSTCLQQKKPISVGLKLKYSLAHKLVFSKLHHKLGGRVQFFVSGGAPLSQEIAQFFHAAGILILEGYGLTETTAALNANSPDSFAFGTVGRPLYGCEEKIAEDGEILVRGPMVAKGYWNRPEATEEVFGSGWFHTGDIGEFDESGHLRITDRKKDIIVTAGGKNIAPQNIENLIKTDPLISQVVVHGDKRKYLVALVTLDPEELKKRGQQLNLTAQGKALVKDPKIYDEVKKVFEEKNKELAKYETIKKFAILDQDFSIESGELTPTLKVKRKVINSRYGGMLDKLYAEG